MEEAVYMEGLLNCVPLDAQVAVSDRKGDECWRGPVRRFPWAMLDQQVLEVRADGGTLSVSTDSDSGDWR